MAEPWFDPNTFGAYAGAILGGGGGTLAGLWGALAGALAPKGKAKTLVIGLGLALAGGGAILLGVGLYALLVGQPYAIWYPLTLAGGVIAIVCAALVPVIRKRYAEAEARQLAAEQFRGQ
jgi:hypothetical protein